MSVKKSAIIWTDQGWNPVTGCVKVSEGCKNCYAEREVETRWSKNPRSVFFGRKFTDVQCHADQLTKPLHWKAPRKIFVCPRGDLFHESVPDEFIDQVFVVMALAPQHTFQVLTKRPERMLAYMARLSRSMELLDDAARTFGYTSFVFQGKYLVSWPLPNIWLGVTVENQAAANERIPLLLQTPAAVRWVSVEPMLGPVDLIKAMGMREPGSMYNGWAELHWVVAGGESGPNARPMHPDWVRALRDQCAAACVQFLFKQWGEWAPNCLCGTKHAHKDTPRPQGKMGCMFRCGTKAAGRLLDGVEHNGYPGVV